MASTIPDPNPGPTPMSENPTHIMENKPPGAQDLNNSALGGMDSLMPAGLRRKFGENEARLHAEKAMSSIHSKYLSEAALEDKELKERWTETLNILLTFGGLLSAIITAFVIAVQPQIEADPMSATNAILLQILQRLDDTTTITPPKNADPPYDATKVLAWWYASLSCSMASTFGALLSKQWVMHYESHPFWASTTEMQALLRESRYQGLAKWKFYGIFEALPILIQISLLLFVIGLVEYLHPSPLLAYIVISFLAIVGAFYLITLLAGTFFPSCPFKSPVTNFLARAAGTLHIRTINTLARIALIFAYPVRLISNGRRTQKFFDVAGSLVGVFALRLGGMVEVSRGEFARFGRDSSLAGVLCSQLQRLDDINDPPVEDLAVAADIIMSLPVKTGAEVFFQRDTYPLWHEQTTRVLSCHPHPRGSMLLKFDLLCHTIYHFPDMINLTRIYAALPAGLDVHDKQATLGHVVDIFRKSWKAVGPGGFLTLPVQHMRPSTVAAYLTFQLHHWSHQAPDERLNEDLLLLDELPLVLGAPWLPAAPLTVATDAITTLSLVLIKNEPLAAPQLQILLQEDPLERLFQALDRLSHYPAEQPPNRLISISLSVSSNLVVNWKGALDQTSWEDGRLMASLFRFLKLGRSWRHLEPVWLRDAPGALLLSCTQTLLSHVLQRSLGAVPELPSMFFESIDDIFATIAHPSSCTRLPPFVSESSLSLLHFVLSTHLAQSSPRSFFSSAFRSRSLGAQPSSSHSPDSLIALLHKYPQVVRQLIRSIREPANSPEQRVAILSVIVRGQDVWFSPAIFPESPRHNQILSDLATLAHLLPTSAGYLPMNALLGFEDKWDALLLALADLEGALPAEDEKTAQVEALDEMNHQYGGPNGGIVPSQQIGLPPAPGPAGPTQFSGPWRRPPVPGNFLQPVAPPPFTDVFGQASAMEMGSHRGPIVPTSEDKLARGDMAHGWPERRL